jgi:type VI secretion system protein ImpB
LGKEKEMPLYEGSVAPKERINIAYQPATGDAQEQIKLPLRLAMIGDYTLRPDDSMVEERAPISVDKDNFAAVMEEQKLSLKINVEDRLSGEPDSQIPMELEFKSMDDFRPESMVKQIPELDKLMQLRLALQSLNGPLGNIPEFRKKLQDLLGDDSAREKLLAELGVSETAEEAEEAEEA